MKSIDPVDASESIVHTYRRYLMSLLPLQDEVLVSRLEKAVSEPGAIAKGPLLEATPPFRSGSSLRELVDDGVLSPEFRRLFSDALPADRPLYLHQETAIRKAVNGRNLIIATGTGSGKTESFLVPILDALIRERDRGTLGPGVRALLLYPMNALANDQLKRLRQVLATMPDITFGRYTGDTVADPAIARERFIKEHGRLPMSNELISRSQIQQEPPHILLTNYAMLEYLLLRPADMELFGGRYADTWRFIVVDEAHVYDGIKGAEIAMLLRRLRARVRPGAALQCMASSATVGDDGMSVVRFGRALFDAAFDWDPGEPEKQDVVRATRVPIDVGDVWGPLSAEAYSALAESTEIDPTSEPLNGRDLAHEKRLREIQAALAKGPQTLEELSQSAFPELTPDVGTRAVVNAVAVAHRVRRPTGGPVLSARYHLFASAVEGAFACFGHTGPHVRTSRHLECPDCAAPMFELAACKRCGQLHLPGQVVKDSGAEVFRSGNRGGRAQHWLLLGGLTEAIDQDDDAHLDTVVNEHPLSAKLCPACGRLCDAGSTQCENCHQSALRDVVRMDTGTELTRCGRCGGRSSRQIRRFVTGADAAAAVLATGLYGHLPADPNVMAPGEGRRLLMFSDSRQQAAFAAPYLQSSYGDLFQRRLIAKALGPARDYELTTTDVVSVVRSEAEVAGVFTADQLRGLGARLDVALWVHRELLEGDERQSLEGTGIARLRLRRPNTPPPKPMLDLGLSADEAWDVMEQLVRTVRVQGAVAPAIDSLDLSDTRLEPRNRAVFIRRDGSDNKFSILSWVPTGRGTSNRRMDYLRRVLVSSDQLHVDVTTALGGIWDFLTSADGPRWFVTAKARNRDSVWRIDPNCIIWQGQRDQPRWMCDLCRQPSLVNVRGVCPTNNCGGMLSPVDGHGIRHPDDHYEHLYRTMEVCPLRAEEHTAQLTREVGSEIQEQFLAGTINVISCSTTFELGVDVGELQSVLLRNVPPTTANYVQRAGRAGRRTDSAALVLTYAQMRSHDQAMFAAPRDMINGTVRAPVVVVENRRVDRRHAHSIVLSEFFRNQFDRHGRTFNTAGDLLSESGTPGPGYEALGAFLDELPGGVLRSVESVLPESVCAELQVREAAWIEFLKELVQDAQSQYQQDISFFQSELSAAVAAKKYKLADNIDRVLRTVNNQNLISLLARRNILPKYGFPVDTVELRVPVDAFGGAGDLDLSRDLTIAINEYAPGSSIVARGRVIKSAGVYRFPKKDLVPRNYGLCPNRDCEYLEVSNESLSAACPQCGAARAGAQTKFVTPVFGFVADRTIGRVGQSRPENPWLSRMHLLERGEHTQGGTAATRLGAVTWDLFVRASMIYLSEGPAGRRYAICRFCGAAEPGRDWNPKKKKHTNPLNGRDCEGGRDFRALAHDFQTDALFLTVPGVVSRSQARSVLYGLLAGAAECLEIARDDLDGTVMSTSTPTIVLFDAVPAGAGLVHRVAENLDDVIKAMYARVARCECGVETSCHRCLRVYRNQSFHDDLRRNDVLVLFGSPAVQAELDVGVLPEGFAPLSSLDDLHEGDIAILDGPNGRAQGAVFIESDDGELLQIGIESDATPIWYPPEDWRPVAVKVVVG